jgi:hypothetical protein
LTINNPVAAEFVFITWQHLYKNGSRDTTRTMSVLFVLKSAESGLLKNRSHLIFDALNALHLLSRIFYHRLVVMAWLFWIKY